MATKDQEKRPAAQVKQEDQQLSSSIGRQVMDALGQPVNLHKVQVFRLWEGHYRVNVLVGADAVSAKVASSYFLVVDGDGNILTYSPKIARRAKPGAGRDRQQFNLAQVRSDDQRIATDQWRRDAP